MQANSPQAQKPIANAVGIGDDAFAEAHGTYGVLRCLDRPDAHSLLSRLLPRQNATALAKGP
jgi:hypothetical protein